MSGLGRRQQDFIDRYESAIGTFPARGKPSQAQLWWVLVDAIPENMLADVFQLVIENRGDDRTKPLIPAFTRAWGHIQERRGMVSETGRVFCYMCDGDGYIIVNAAPPTKDKPQWRFDDMQDRLYPYAFPCKCSAGKQRLVHWTNPPDEYVRQEAWDVLVATRRATNCIDAPDGKEPLMTVREYLAIAENPQRSPVTFAFNIRQESARLHAVRNKQDSSQFHGHDPEKGNVADHWRSLAAQKDKKKAEAQKRAVGTSNVQPKDPKTSNTTDSKAEIATTHQQPVPISQAIDNEVPF